MRHEFNARTDTPAVIRGLYAAIALMFFGFAEFTAKEELHHDKVELSRPHTKGDIAGMVFVDLFVASYILLSAAGGAVFAAGVVRPDIPHRLLG